LFVGYAVVVLLALMLFASAGAKLTRQKPIVEDMARIGVPVGMFGFLASCEIAGAVGLVVGLVFAPLGVAAAVGLVLYFIGAVGAHVRKADYKGTGTPLMMLTLAVAALVLQILSF
jgi:DoxX-like family